MHTLSVFKRKENFFSFDLAEIILPMLFSEKNFATFQYL